MTHDKENLRALYRVTVVLLLGSDPFMKSKARKVNGETPPSTREGGRIHGVLRTYVTMPRSILMLGSRYKFQDLGLHG